MSERRKGKTKLVYDKEKRTIVTVSTKDTITLSRVDAEAILTALDRFNWIPEAETLKAALEAT